MRVTDFVESYFDAWNRHDPEAVGSHLSEQGIYRDVPEDTRFTRLQFIAYLGGFFAEYQHRYELRGEIQRGPNSVAFEYRMFPSNASTAESAVSHHGAEFMTLNGNAATFITDYYDRPQKIRVEKYARSGLTEEQLEMYKARLKKAMNDDLAYLHSDLTLPKLAQQIGCSVNHLSQVINSGFGSSFFDYLNRHRIEHARMIMSHPETRDRAILNVAFSVGFNSSSAFYAAFKKFVGQTPVQFRSSLES